MMSMKEDQIQCSLFIIFRVIIMIGSRKKNLDECHEDNDYSDFGHITADRLDWFFISSLVILLWIGCFCVFYVLHACPHPKDEALHPDPLLGTISCPDPLLMWSHPRLNHLQYFALSIPSFSSFSSIIFFLKRWDESREEDEMKSTMMVIPVLI